MLARRKMRVDDGAENRHPTTDHSADCSNTNFCPHRKASSQPPQLRTNLRTSKTGSNRILRDANGARSRYWSETDTLDAFKTI